MECELILIKPEDIKPKTELDQQYAQELKTLKTAKDFEIFKERWQLWLDDETKKLSGDDFVKMESLIADCRKEGVEITDKHKPAMALIMPGQILIPSLIAAEFKVPWGLAYLRIKGKI